jgi:hypothetical protein
MAIPTEAHDVRIMTCRGEPGSSVVRLCCAISSLVQALTPPVPHDDPRLRACAMTCKPEPSRTEGSPWRSECGAS